MRADGAPPRVSPDHSSSLGVAAAEWEATHRVRVGEWNVRFRAAGSGPPVVLVHGLGVSADYWVRNAPVVAAAGYRVLAPDLPGFGRTDGPARGLSIPEQALAVADWAAALGFGPATYVGHSLSAQAMLELAARQPERVHALVLIAPTGAPGHARVLRQAWRLFLDLFREPWPLIPIVALAYLRAGPRRYWGTWRAGVRHKPLALLPEVRAPTAVVAGTRDPVVEHGFAAALATGLARGRLVCIEGAAHAVQFDQAEAFNRALIGFLDELHPSSTRESAR